MTGHDRALRSIIRRRTLDWVRGAREVHAYVGATTPGWVDQLRFGAEDRGHHREELVGRREEFLAGLAAGRAELAGAERLVQQLVAGAPRGPLSRA